MNAIAKPLLGRLRFFWALPRPFNAAHRRKQATVDLIHSSPHLLRDIGLVEHKITIRQR